MLDWLIFVGGLCVCLALLQILSDIATAAHKVGDALRTIAVTVRTGVPFQIGGNVIVQSDDHDDEGDEWKKGRPEP